MIRRMIRDRCSTGLRIFMIVASSAMALPRREAEIHKHALVAFGDCGEQPKGLIKEVQISIVLT